MAIAPNTILQGRYRIIRQLGRGGMGEVYESIDDRLNSMVAIKEAFINDDETRRAFEREANLLANLRHPSLPKVIDHFIEDNHQFLVMEFIQGTDLAKLLAMRGRAVSPEQVVHWGEITLGVLEYLHKRNPPILHRDIKPANLKLDEDGELFLLDFGLAKGAAGQMPTIVTSRSVRGYTPVYAPIEQIFGKGTDERSDLYAVGATLYHLITNLIPVDAPTRYLAIEDDQPDPLRPAHEVNPEVPFAVALVLARSMAINRKHRPSSATEMKLALRDASQTPSSQIKSGQKSAAIAPAMESQPADGSSEKLSPTAVPAPIQSSPPESKSSPLSQAKSPTEETIIVEDKRGKEIIEASVSSKSWNVKRVRTGGIVSLCLILAVVVYGLVNRIKPPTSSVQQDPGVASPSTQSSTEVSGQSDEQKVEVPETVSNDSSSHTSNNLNAKTNNNRKNTAPTISTNRPAPTPSMNKPGTNRQARVVRNNRTRANSNSGFFNKLKRTMKQPFD